MVRPSMPPASASLMASSTARSRLSGSRRFALPFFVSMAPRLDNLTAYGYISMHQPYEVSLKEASHECSPRRYDRPRRDRRGGAAPANGGGGGGRLRLRRCAPG